MSRNSEEVRVAVKSEVFVAPVGTALPEDPDPTTFDAAFVGLGYTTDDGVGFSYDPSIENVMSAQSAYPVRQINGETNVQASFSGLQWNPQTFALAFGGGEWEDLGGGVSKYEPLDADDPLAEQAVILAWSDGDKKDCVVFPRSSIAEPVETTLVRTAASSLPVTLKSLSSDDDDLPPWFALTNHMTEGS